MITRSERNKMFIKIEGFLQHALQPDMEEVLSRIGLYPEILSNGQTLLESWKAQRIVWDTARDQARQITREKNLIRKQGRQYMRTLHGLARRRFYNDPQVLNTLGLIPKTQTVVIPAVGQESGETGEPSPEIGGSQEGSQENPAPNTIDGEGEVRVRRAVPARTEETNVLVKWRSFIQGVLRLPEEKRQFFTNFGYTDEKLAEIEASFNIHAGLMARKETIFKARSQQATRFKNIERELLTWLYCIRTLLKTNESLLTPEDNPLILAITHKI